MSSFYMRTEPSRPALPRKDEVWHAMAETSDLAPDEAFDPDGSTETRAADGDALRRQAMRLLTRREHSRAELARKLTDSGAEADNVAALLDRLEELGLLSDQRFAESFIRAKAQRFGTARLKHDLAAKGVPEALARDALAELAAHGSELERARQIWQRKFSTGPSDAREFARQARFLQGRGFSPDVIRRLLKDGRPIEG